MSKQRKGEKIVVVFFPFKTLFELNFVVCARVVCYEKASDSKPNMKGWVFLHSICLTSCATPNFFVAVHEEGEEENRDFFSLHRDRNKQNKTEKKQQIFA